MALVKMSHQIVADPDSLKAIYSTFKDVEEIPTETNSLYKVFRIKGQGVPDSDQYIKMSIRRTLEGKVSIDSWQPADKITGL